MTTKKHYSTGPIDSFREQVSDLHRFKKKYLSRFEELTDREVEVLKLVAEGKTNQGIANYLNISRATVQNHRAKIRDKLNINNQVDFVKFALAYELIDF